MAHVSLSLLGPFQVTLDGQPVTGFESAQVLAYLAIEADRPHRRETLAGLLWPDWPDRAAISNLRHALANLRQTIGDRLARCPFLLIARSICTWRRARSRRASGMCGNRECKRSALSCSVCLSGPLP
jgi:DNA-binding SARP family transcriptional activator